MRLCAMLYVIKMYFWREGEEFYRFFSRTRYVNFPGIPTAPQYEHMMNGAREVTLQSMNATVSHGVTVAYPYSTLKYWGEYAGARSWGWKEGQGRRNDPFNNGYLPNEYCLLISKITKRGRWGQELAPYSLQNGDIIERPGGRALLRPDHNRTLNLQNINSRIYQAVSDWGFSEDVPRIDNVTKAVYQVDQVVGYRLSGVVKRKAHADIQNRKWSYGKDGKRQADRALRYAVESGEQIQQLITRWGNTIPAWQRQNMLTKHQNCSAEIVALCTWFHTPPSENVRTTAWEVKDYDPAFEEAANLIIQLMPLLKEGAKQCSLLAAQTNPEPQGSAYWSMYLIYEYIFWALHVSQQCRFTGHVQPAQLKGLKCGGES